MPHFCKAPISHQSAECDHGRGQDPAPLQAPFAVPLLRKTSQDFSSQEEADKKKGWSFRMKPGRSPARHGLKQSISRINRYEETAILHSLHSVQDGVQEDSVSPTTMAKCARVSRHGGLASAPGRKNFTSRRNCDKKLDCLTCFQSGKSS